MATLRCGNSSRSIHKDVGFDDVMVTQETDFPSFAPRAIPRLRIVDEAYAPHRRFEGQIEKVAPDRRPAVGRMTLTRRGRHKL